MVRRRSHLNSYKKATKELFEGKTFDTPKPIELLLRMFTKLTTFRDKENAIVLDFFAEAPPLEPMQSCSSTPKTKENENSSWFSFLKPVMKSPKHSRLVKISLKSTSWRSAGPGTKIKEEKFHQLLLI